MKKIIIVLFALVILGCSQQEKQLVGGDKDIHGCIGSAGYSWCEEKSKCVRVWEEGCKAAEMTKELCESSKGNWNECSNKCQLANQGKEGAACTLQCEQLCECSGLAGFKCPAGYSCKVLAENVADALGYCVPEE